jgi:signal transduction histidine kinase/streptogramin lyase
VVYSIASGRDGLWVGRQQGGLTLLRSQPGSPSSTTYTTAQGLAQNSVYSVYESRDGSVWAGTLSGGVSRLSQGRFTTYSSEQGLAANTVAAMAQGSDGTMWFATPRGLSAFERDRWTTFGIRDGLPSENINCLLQDSHNVLWIGTANGLSFWSDGAIHTPAQNTLSLHDQILGIAEDRMGSLWIATSAHVLRLNRNKLLGGALADGDVREFTVADGLRGNEGVKRSRSVIPDEAGRIWFSMNRGISVVDPARVTNQSAPAIVHVDALSADGAAIRLGNSIHIPRGARRLTVEYAGLSLSIPERVRFRYMLEGFEHQWSSPVAAREAVFTNLSPGTYRFRVVASNPDGVWNPQEAALEFVVDPLVWQTWWFRAAVLIGCGFAALALYRFRLRQLARRLNLRFEERLAERTRIAQELHDTLLQGFVSVSMQVHVAADGLPEDSKVKPTLARALQCMGQVIEEGRNAVRGLRSPKSASLDLEQAFSRILLEADPLGANGVDFRVIVEGPPKPLHPLLRDEVYRIGREAVINALRHARANQIEVELKYSSSQFRVFVRDDGLGIDPAIIAAGRDGHWGLSGMRERADRIGAQLHVYSRASAGTEVVLVVPGKLAFAKN